MTHPESPERLVFKTTSPSPWWFSSLLKPQYHRNLAVIFPFKRQHLAASGKKLPWRGWPSLAFMSGQVTGDRGRGRGRMQARSPEGIGVASVLGHALRRGVHVKPRKIHGHGLKSYCRSGEKAMQGVNRVETHRQVCLLQPTQGTHLGTQTSPPQFE